MSTTILLFLTTTTIISHGHPEFQAQIPNGANVVDPQGNPWPGVGHLARGGGGPRNPFGLDFAANNFEWTSALCAKDSDGDGATNGYELGDPHCIWQPGDTPTRVTNITHPGFAGDAAPTAINTCLGVQSHPTAINLTVTLDPYTVPTATTTYVRQAFDMRAIVNEDFDVIRFDPILSTEGVTIDHHMLMYSCTEAEVKNFLAGPVTTGGMPCTQGIVLAWAIGGYPFCFPDGVALKFKTSSPYVLIEVHINNAAQTAGIVTSPGFRITGVPTASQTTATTPASWLWSGIAIDRIAIPAGQSAYEISGTANMPGASLSSVISVSIIAILGHSHYLGRKIFLEVEDSRGTSASGSNGIRQLYCDPLYSNANQELVPKVAPYPIVTNKDILHTHCVYDSTGRTTTTYGGESTENEMCFVFALFIDTLNVGNIVGITSSASNIVQGSNGVPSLTECIASTADTSNGNIIIDLTQLLPQWLVAHITLAGMSFGLFVPLGTLFPASAKMRNLQGKCCGKPVWFIMHRSFVSTAILGLLAWCLSYEYSSFKLTTSHGKLGTAIFTFAIVQGMLGVFRPHLPENGEMKSTARKAFEIIHPWLGRSIVMFSAAQVWLGYQLLLDNWFNVGINGRSSIAEMQWVHGVGFFFVWGIVAITLNAIKYCGKKNNSKNDKGKDVTVAAAAIPVAAEVADTGYNHA